MTDKAIELLKLLITTPSFSREEADTADILAAFLQKSGVSVLRKQNNVWAKSLHFDENKPTLLLNSHHDTVKPVQGWQRDPFRPTVEDGRLYGLGSNDAGASLVALLTTFVHFYRQQMPFNLLFAATAEEEISGANGIAALLPELGKIDCGIVGEPTEMQMAIAEKGLMVIDATAHGKAGHAAREEGENAIYAALRDIEWIRTHRFEAVSPMLGATKMSVTQIAAGTQHNVVPDACRFVIDVRTTDAHCNEELFAYLQQHLSATLVARSFRLNSSKIDPQHPLVQRGVALGLPLFGSSTLSDQALMNFPTVKMGVGKSERSHSADEFIYLHEIENGIATYIKLLQGLVL